MLPSQVAASSSSNSDVLQQQHPRRRYAAPPPGGYRSKQDGLHQWSIYRQNINSAFAGGILPPGTIPEEADLEGGGSPPYGDFQMQDNAVESVLYQGRQDDMVMADQDPDVYLRFGLPRVALPAPDGGQMKLQKPTDHFRKASRMASSELDLSSRNGNYLQQRHRHPNHLAASLEHGLDRLHDGSYSPPGGHYAFSQIAIDAAVPPAPSGAFLQSSRHHAHYFSNTDLFGNRDAAAAYNYLRYTKAEDLPQSTSGVDKLPRLQVRDVSYDADQRTDFDVVMLGAPKHRRMLDNVSFDLCGGETLAIMYTNESEVKTLFGLLSDRLNHRHGHVEGRFLINGTSMSLRSLGQRVSYVRSEDPYPRLTVGQHLKLVSSFTKPATDAFRTKSMIAQLIQTLALSPFENRLVGELGRTEKQRVKVACQILLDTDVLLLDDITKDMDLYDAAFVIDYLRDWAAKLNRIVMVASSPPTHEILTMFYKAAILASGRLVYFGRSHSMLNYFESLEYPCPLFKNPCDYYTDLVTYDHLTTEAAAESRERIRRLADLWEQKSADERLMTDNPSPKVVLPTQQTSPGVKKANCCSALWTIYARFWYILSNHPWEYIRELLFSLLLSIALGVTFYELFTDTVTGIEDRFGLFYSLLIVFSLPIAWLNIERISSERVLLYSDSKDRLYSKTVYVIVKWLFDFPFALLCYLCFVIPVYFMAGLRSVSSPGLGALPIIVYAVTTVIHGLVLRYLAWVTAYTVRAKIHAAALFGILVTIFALSAGVIVNFSDQFVVTTWLAYGTPSRYAVDVLSLNEFVGTQALIESVGKGAEANITDRQLTFTCEPTRITKKQGNVPIVIVKTCPSILGSQALTFYDVSLLNSGNDPKWLGDSRPVAPALYIGALVSGVWILSALLLSCCCCVHCNHRPATRIQRRT